MDKKSLISIIVAILIILAAGAAAIYFLNRPKDNNSDNQTNDQTASNNEEPKVENGKILVAYYSAQNHTKTVAEKIAANLGANTFEIVPQEIYINADLDWTADDSRVNREHENESLRNIALVSTEVPNWDEYKTILIGYPIWWGIAAWPVNNFIKNNDFTDKTVIPFCTSASSGLGQSGELLEAMAGTGNWLPGYRFSSNPTDSDIQNWLNSIK